jgi:DnaJ-class molecular chaperone
MTNRNKDGKPYEIKCIECMGTGTRPNESVRLGIVICSSCNGHGVKMYDPLTRRVSRLYINQNNGTAEKLL